MLGSYALWPNHTLPWLAALVSEEMPNLGKKSGITGKELEGLADSTLKVFGI